MQVMLCQSDLILLHKWGLDDSQSHTTVFSITLCRHILIAMPMFGNKSFIPLFMAKPENSIKKNLLLFM